MKFFILSLSILVSTSILGQKVADIAAGIKLGIVNTHIRETFSIESFDITPYGRANGFRLNAFGRMNLSQKIALHLELGYLKRRVHDNDPSISILVERAPIVTLEYLNLPLLLHLEIMKNYRLGLGAAGNLLLTSAETTIAEQDLELEGILEFSRRFGKSIELSLQYTRGLNTLASQYYQNPLTQIEGLRRYFSRSIYLNLAYMLL